MRDLSLRGMKKPRNSKHYHGCKSLLAERRARTTPVDMARCGRRWSWLLLGPSIADHHLLSALGLLSMAQQKSRRINDPPARNLRCGLHRTILNVGGLAPHVVELDRSAALDRALNRRGLVYPFGSLDLSGQRRAFRADASPNEDSSITVQARLQLCQ